MQPLPRRGANDHVIDSCISQFTEIRNLNCEKREKSQEKGRGPRRVAISIIEGKGEVYFQ
ncbi:hypothetical protein MTR_3g034070 [Medicago truncatula]|uniref:Uncharacterized protein n=1 Tax=Medicago truncatula TaxID=3880 RepID=G7IX70_MEDTR|nr:hypothetical protein MTR_3g034070 [Medicago truncatula]